MKNYPFRSLYVDDNHPFADKSSTKSISLIQNWDSISDKEFFGKRSFLHRFWNRWLGLGSCSRAPSCSFWNHKKPATPIITNIETHRRSNCVLTRTCLGPTDDYNEYTTVIDTSIETQDWNIENQHLFSKQAKRPIPFSSQESRTRDNIIRDCSFSDCQKFISSPFGVGCRIFAFGECRWHLTFQM